MAAGQSIDLQIFQHPARVEEKNLFWKKMVIFGNFNSEWWNILPVHGS